MIIDFQADEDHARLFDVCDAATLQRLGPEYNGVWYADDSRDVIRRYLMDEKGMILLAWEGNPTVPLIGDAIEQWNENNEGIQPPICAAWVEERLPIRILRKQEA